MQIEDKLAFLGNVIYLCFLLCIQLVTIFKIQSYSCVFRILAYIMK